MCAYSYLEYIGWCLVNISLMNFLLNMVEMMSFITFPALSDCTSYMHKWQMEIYIRLAYFKKSLIDRSR